MMNDRGGQLAELICNLGCGFIFLYSEEWFERKTGACTWTMSLSAYLPLEEILISSPSNSTMAKENINKMYMLFLTAVKFQQK